MSEIEDKLEDSGALLNIASDSWHLSDFKSQVDKRLGGVTRESFIEDVEIWQLQISSMPSYNESKLRKEISQMDFDIPERDDFNFENTYIAYSKHVAYRNRIVEMISIVHAHAEMFTQAHKALEKAAFKLFSKSGGSVDDKKADATHAIAPFVWGETNAKILLNYLEEVKGSIEFASQQLSRILREHEALSRINGGYEKEGHSRAFQKPVEPVIPRRSFRDLREDDEIEIS